MIKDQDNMHFHLISSLDYEMVSVTEILSYGGEGTDSIT